MAAPSVREKIKNVYSTYRDGTFINNILDVFVQGVHHAVIEYVFQSRLFKLFHFDACVQVIVACRDLESAKRAAAGLRGETMNGTSVYHYRCVCMFMGKRRAWI